MDFKEEINILLKKALKQLSEGLKDKAAKDSLAAFSSQGITIEMPPDPKMGDYAFPCFALSKLLKKNPAEISKDISALMPKKLLWLSEIKTLGPYLNFFINRDFLAEQTVDLVLQQKKDYGSSEEGRKKKIVIDMSSPNIAKPFGIGHLRSTIIGNSIAAISSFMGFDAIKINYLGDWGTQFGKLIVGFKRFGSEKELEKNPVKHLLDIYVKANSEEYEQESRDWFKKLENGDKEALKLWKKFRDLSLIEFSRLYKIMGIKFDVISGESMYNDKMESTIKELKSKKLLKEDQGALIVDLEKYNLGVCLIKKSDGATLYATRDLTAAIDRFKTYKFARMIYEVGQEQKLHFQQVFKVLELMGYDFAKSCVHVYHGLYLDNDGKKFATRKGKTVFMEDILDETIALAKKTIKEKNPDLKDKDEVARKVAVAAIFYGDLKNNRTNDMVFDIDRFVEFEGNTGPYLLYSYARASSIIRKAGAENQKSKAKLSAKSNKKSSAKSIASKASLLPLNESEIALVKKISEFPAIVKKAYDGLNPSVVAMFAFDLAQAFNEFYHACPILKEEEKLKQSRLLLVECFRMTLGNALKLLGIEAVEEM